MKVLDYDRFSRDDPIGELCVPLCDVDLANGETLCRALQSCKGQAVSLSVYLRCCILLAFDVAFYSIFLCVFLPLHLLFLHLLMYVEFLLSKITFEHIVKKVKSFPSHMGPCGGADLCFL